MNIGNIGGPEYLRNTSSVANNNIAAKEQPAIAEPQDKMEFAVNSNGKVKLIVNADTPEALAQIKEKLSPQGEMTKNSVSSKITADLPLINGIALELDQSQLGLIAGLGSGINVWNDGLISIPTPVAVETSNEIGAKMDVATQTLGLDKLHAQGFTGKDTTICVIDTGIAQHPDVKDRIIAFKDFVNGKDVAYDDQGHGTHCAGIAAGDGSSSGGKFVGSAPEANLVGVKVLDRNGSGNFSDVIKGIQWAIENKDSLGIDVVSMSLGGGVTQSSKKDPVSLAAEKAVEAGLIMCVAAGNEGPRPGTIGTPGNAEKVITVGAMNDKGTVDKSDDDMANFSSVGPTKIDGLMKPDIIAPGVNITAAAHNGTGYVSMSGTSMATPCAAGVMAIAAQVKPGINPMDLKKAAMDTADKLPNSGYDGNKQGAGCIDPKELLMTINPELNLA